MSPYNLYSHRGNFQAFQLLLAYSYSGNLSKLNWIDVQFNDISPELVKLMRQFPLTELNLIQLDENRTVMSVSGLLRGLIPHVTKETAPSSWIDWTEHCFLARSRLFISSLAGMLEHSEEAISKSRDDCVSCLKHLESSLSAEYFSGGLSAGLSDAIIFPVVFCLLDSAEGLLPAAERQSLPQLIRWVEKLKSLDWVGVARAAYANVGACDLGDGLVAGISHFQGLAARRHYPIKPLQEKPYMITTPIYYVNGTPHIGHVYTTLLCDTMARWLRVRGAKVLFMTGTDEHGQKVMQAAHARGKTPYEFATEVSNQFRTCFDSFEFKYDRFIRTTEDAHRKCVHEIWNRMVAKGDIYVGCYEGWYCTSDEAYYTAPEVEEHVDANGSKYMRAKASGQKVEWMKEENLMFRLSKYAEPLLEWLNNNPTAILPRFRQKEIMAFIRGGLNDLSVSRTTFDWGIPVPGHEKHVMYVWIDALSNYLTVAGFPNEEGRPFWPADYQVVGKDILRFHAVYWPAMLMSAGVPLPKRMIAHGWWTKDKTKISKSLGNVFDPVEVGRQYGLDTLRYFMLRSASIESDGDYSSAMLEERLNKELADGLGNLVMRALSRAILKDGVVLSPGALDSEDAVLRDELNLLAGTVDHHFHNFAFQDALAAVFSTVDMANLYVNQNRPWELAKKDDATSKQRLGTVMYVLLETVRMLAILLLPVLPSKMADVLTWLKVPPADWNASNLQFGYLSPGHELGVAGVLFTKAGPQKLLKQWKKK